MPPNTTLRQLREAQYLTQPELANLLGVNVDTVRGWESGRIGCPRGRQLRVLARTLHVPVEALGFQLRNASPTGDCTTAPWDIIGVSRAIAIVCEAGDMERRIFNFLAGAPLTRPAQEWLLACAPELNEHIAGRRVTRETAEYLDEETRLLRLKDDHMGGREVLDQVMHQVSYLKRLLSDYSYNETIGRRLYANIADLLRLAGLASFDLGRHAQAQHLWITALHAAHAAGDHAQGANILGFMSEQACELRQAAESVTLAQAASEGYRGKDPKVAAILHLRAAQAHSTQSEFTKCQHAVDAALESLRNSPNSEGTPGWAYWGDEIVTHAFAAGNSYIRLGQWQLAREHLEVALDQADDSFARDKAIWYTYLARVYLEQNEPERACEAANNTTRLLESQVESARATSYLTRFCRSLKPYRYNLAVREFKDRAKHLLVDA